MVTSKAKTIKLARIATATVMSLERRDRIVLLPE
jgi:hypothetical protein